MWIVNKNLYLHLCMYHILGWDRDRRLLLGIVKPVYPNVTRFASIARSISLHIDSLLLYSMVHVGASKFCALSRTSCNFSIELNLMQFQHWAEFTYCGKSQHLLLLSMSLHSLRSLDCFGGNWASPDEHLMHCRCRFLKDISFLFLKVSHIEAFRMDSALHFSNNPTSAMWYRCLLTSSM